MKKFAQDLNILWYFFRSYKLQCFVVLVLMLISGIMETLNLAALYPIINYGLNVGNKNMALSQFEKLTRYISSDNPFWAACIVLIVISVLSLLLNWLYNYFSQKLTIRLVGDTQKKVFRKFLFADYNFYVKSQQGKLIYAGTTAPERINTITMNTVILTYSLINAFFLFILLMILSWQATFFILFVGFLYAFVLKNVMQKFIQKCARIYVYENQQKNVILNELITGIKPIKAFVAFKEWIKKYTHAVDRGLSNRFRMNMGKVFPQIFVRFIFFILIAIAGILLSQMPPSQMIALLPVFGTFGVVVNRFLPSAHLIGNSMMSIIEYIPDAKIVHNLCTQDLTLLTDGEESLDRFEDKILFDNVCFKYANMDKDLLKSVSFSIERRRVTAIVGRSGSGKTTIINLLLKFYKPDKGYIRIDGKDIFDLKNESYLSRIGYVSQETFIFNSSFKENIRFGLEDCTDQAIEEAARLANADEFIRATPEGYDTIVGDSGVKISGGQRQRLAIARAILRNPEIIILDEATSSLDNISEKKIQTAINNISKYTTVLVIAHRLSTVRHADKIIIIENGEIKEQGTHQELLNNKNLYYSLQRSRDEEKNSIDEILDEKPLDEDAQVKEV